MARVSDPKPGKQDEKSLDDQEALYREWLDANVKAPYRLTMIAGSGSGELLDREEFQKFIDEVTTDKYDFAISEDLGRIVRRIHAHLVCEHCEDHNTRLYARNDHVDTALPNWCEASIFAAFHHERANRDTSERIKRTHRSRFMNGGCLRQQVYGWIKPPGAKNDAEMTKDLAAEAVYREWFRMLDEDEATFAEVARWLRPLGVVFPSRYRGQYREPDGKSVARHTFNLLLKGVRERNRRKTRRINNRGKYISRKAEPHELLRRNVPHLAHFDAAYFDRVVAKVKARNANFRRSEDPAADSCRGRPRKATRHPGRVTFCGVCGRPFVWGGNGQRDHMMCSGARDLRCWNGVTFDGSDEAVKMAAAVLAEVERLEEFDAVFLRDVQEEARRLDERREKTIGELRDQRAAVDRGIANIVGFVREGKAGPSLAEDLDRLEREQARLVAELTCAEEEPANVIDTPPVERIKELARQCLKDVAADGAEFARVMRRLVPRIIVLPHRLCDGGAVVLRARFRLQLGGLLPDRRTAEVLRGPLERVVTLDLFEHPQREACRERITAARAAGKTEREAAEACGITVTAAQRAAALQRKMDELGVVDPYIPVLRPPADCPKLRRHRHADYRFDPLPGAGEI